MKFFNKNQIFKCLKIGKFAAAVKLLLLLLFANLALVQPSFAENNATARAVAGDGYGRMIFTFDKLPNYEIDMLEGVLVIKFNEEVKVDVSLMSEKLSDYIVVGRTDPDRTGARFALSQEIKINKIEAAEKLFIDLLPKTWTGLPPGLPEEVIAELAARAEEAEIAAREKVLREELKKAKNKLLIRYGELPTFTRLFFDWKLPVETKMERNGDIVTLRFNHYAQPIVKDLKASPPKFLKKIDYKVTRTELVINLAVEAGTDVRGFKEGMGFVIDLSNGDGGQIERLSETIVDSKIAEQGGLVKRKTDENDVARNAIKFLSSDEPAEEKTTPKPETKKEEQAPKEEKTVVSDQDDQKAEDEKETVPALPEAKATEVVTLPEAKKEIQTQATPEPQPEQKPTPSQPGEELLKIGEVIPLSIGKQEVKKVEPVDNTKLPDHLAQTSISNQDSANQKDPEARTAPKNYKRLTVDAEQVNVRVQRVNRQYDIIFPFKEDVPMAAFERNGLFWLVFDKKINFDVRELEAAAPELIKINRLENIDNMTIIRLDMDKRLLAQIGTKNSDWILSVGELVLMDTKVLKLDRSFKQNGHAVVEINLPDAGKVHWITDENIGDRLAVVTAKGPARGLLKTHNFVEFSALPSVHGVVFRALGDSLTVNVAFDQVTVASKHGLSLTVGKNFNNMFENFAQGEVKKPSHIQFKEFDRERGNFVEKRRALVELIDEAKTEKEKSIFRLEMAELLLSYQLPFETLGMLKLEAFLDPAAANTARFKSLEGAALAMSGKYKEAINALSAVAIRNDKTATLFRAYALAKTEMYQEALKDYDVAMPVLSQYPSKIQADFIIPAVEAALEIPNLNLAQKHLIMLKNDMTTDYQIAKYWLLMAHFSRLNDDIEAAIERYKKASAFDVRPVRAEADGILSVLEYQHGLINIDEAIDQLNGNVVLWKGDKIEQRNVINLGKLYMDKGDYREGLRTLKRAAQTFGDGDMGRETAAYMSEIFESLYLGDQSSGISPFKSLSLFYEFRDLTPVGRKGDEMIRNLVDRLIDVDLLDQATELLEHQVNKRLKGIAKADVASKLAMVQLLNYQPEKAIRTIATSRIADMPKHITRRRDILEARALVEIGRTQSAITRLEGYEGKDISLIKSEAYWRGNFWQKAGEEFENIMGNKWQSPEPLLEMDRHLILRSAIAYKMANDSLSLGRLRKQYMPKMENTSHADSFNLVVDINQNDAVQFRKLAREVAEVDMLKDFIEEFRANENRDILDRQTG